MIARRVRLHRPQSAPAPQASAICFEVFAPLATTSLTTWLVAPVHRQTSIAAPSDLLADGHQVGEPADELLGIGAETRFGHPLGRGVGVLNPLPSGALVLDLLQDHHFPSVVERLVNPDLSNSTALESLDAVMDFDHQLRDVVDGGHHPDDHATHVLLGRPAIEVDFLDHLAAEHRRNIVGAGNAEPFEYLRRTQYLTN